jgi:hypothetical protein
MDKSLENIQKSLNESVRRLNLNRQDEENDSFSYFSNLLIGETTDIISEITNNLEKQKYNQMIRYIFMHLKLLARNMASNQKQFEILQNILDSESKLSEEDIVDINYCLQVVERNIDLLKEFKRENRTQINEFLPKRRSIDKITETSHKVYPLTYLLSAFPFAIIPFIVFKAYNEDLLNPNNVENDDSENIFKRFETIESIKNRVKDVLQDENRRKKNLYACKNFLEESTELTKIINEILNIDVHTE